MVQFESQWGLTRGSALVKTAAIGSNPILLENRWFLLPIGRRRWRVCRRSCSTFARHSHTVARFNFSVFFPFPMVVGCGLEELPVFMFFYWSIYPNSSSDWRGIIFFFIILLITFILS